MRGGATGGGGNGGSEGMGSRQPQSVQSVPYAQNDVSLPGPPSSQVPSPWKKPSSRIIIINFPDGDGGGGGEGDSGGGGGEGEGNGGGSDGTKRGPQSVQSVPKAQ